MACSLKFFLFESLNFLYVIRKSSVVFLTLRIKKVFKKWKYANLRIFHTRESEDGNWRSRRLEYKINLQIKMSHSQISWDTHTQKITKWWLFWTPHMSILSISINTKSLYSSIETKLPRLKQSKTQLHTIFKRDN